MMPPPPNQMPQQQGGGPPKQLMQLLATLMLNNRLRQKSQPRVPHPNTLQGPAGARMQELARMQMTMGGQRQPY